ncbi:MAG: glycosyltransferase [Candidatus Saganbacteria bacterium]|uniref:Glycosyltransferase n=1 Tax=Candidatus Saganbacteria bacterium TaxID=2575572 RepID=A0A833NXL0_UNCSA|nr:MAG: glycosyltransferase [Candidatus Saganbacteria bacterium]
MLKPELNIVFVGNYSPRLCGIATFTTDLCEAAAKLLSPRSSVFAIAVNDTDGRYAYPRRVEFIIQQTQQKDYFEAANFINASNADVVCIQHEYGIYGGWDGIYILSLISSLSVPAVVVLHTVLKNPTPNQKKIIQEMAQRASYLIVMSNLAVTLLKEVYSVPAEKIRMLYHGTPDFTSLDNNRYKKRFQVEGKQTLLTFGLLSPNKGIETVIKALPKIVQEFPQLIYVVLGKTHPNVLREYGEKYRTSLVALVEELGLQEQVIFDNRFVSLEELYAWLMAADIYITPYLNEAQIVSGTLSYAIGAGNAIISTPYWYAKEILAEGRGRLINFGDSNALASSLRDLLSDKTKLKSLRDKTYKFGRQMRWEKVSEKYLEIFKKTAATAAKRSLTLKTPALLLREPPFDLAHLKRLTDDTGLIQHAKYIVPDRHTGYCLDDNSRALMMCAWAFFLLRGEDAKELISTYFSFTHFMQNPDGRFRNFIDYQRHFLDESGSDDACGRALWALGYIIWRPPRNAYRSLAYECFQKALPHVRELNLRGKSLAMLGLVSYLRCYQGDESVAAKLRECADYLLDLYKNVSDDNWRWFEDIICYDNGIMPMALFQTYSILREEKYLKAAKETLEFLEKTITHNGRLSIVGSRGWYKRGGIKAKYDQQPIDAAAMVLAYQSAYRVTKEKEYLKKMRQAFGWFLGENDMGMSLYDHETKGCADGLMPEGVSLNQGGESTVSFLMALLAMIEEYEISSVV